MWGNQLCFENKWVDNKPFSFQDFSKENIHFVELLRKPSGVFKSYGGIKTVQSRGKTFISGFSSIMQFQANGRE